MKGFNKEVPHARRQVPFCPPPRSTSSPIGLLLRRVWLALPEPNKRRILQGLRRAIASQLALLGSDAQEVHHEPH